MEAETNTGKLYIVATPIGNLKDITYRAVEILSKVDIILCEDTKNSHKLLSHYGISTKTYPYNDHSKVQIREKVLDLLGSGKSIALISDAGTPLISDPGFKLVKECKNNDIKVIPIPGPSAAIAALCVSGQTTDKFYFNGFLPTKATVLQSTLTSLANIENSMIFYESPKRIYKTVEVIYQMMGDREIVMAREMTKIYEEFICLKCSEFLAQYAEAQFRGEIVLIVAGKAPEQQDHNRADLRGWLTQLLADHTLKEAVEIVRDVTKMSKKEIYQEALKLKQ